MPQRRLLFTMIALVIAAFAANLVASFPVSEAGLRLLNALVPLAISLGFGGLALWMVATSPLLIWTPMVMFFVNMAVFRGVGPLVYVYASQATQAKIWSGAWGLTASELFSTHVLNLVGAAAVVAGLLLVSLSHEPRLRPLASRLHGAGVPTAAITLFLIGATVRYGIVLPAAFGASEIHVPGFVRNLRLVLDLAFALFAYLAVKRGGRWALLFWLLFPPHFLSLVLEFKKSAVALGIMLPVLGVYLATGRLRGLILGAVSILLLTVSLHPVVKLARAEMTVRSGAVTGAPLGDRIDILHDLVFGNVAAAQAPATGQEAQVGWVRLSYAAQQAIAMRSYDAGQPRDTFSDAWQVFIPRFFWPQKPNFSNFSSEFYREITGNAGALAGATVFADAYWNFGWGGVVVIGLIAGLFFGLTSRFAMRVVHARDFVLLPAVFLAMDMALREMNGWILTGLFGPVPFLFAYVAITGLIRAPVRQGQVV